MAKEKEDFQCSHCARLVLFSEFIGTEHRNHCPFCLWSKHLDLEKAGDRKSKCQADMEPIGLTFKKEGVDRSGKPKRGELMLIHQCSQCGKISINRIAGDDEAKAILNLFEKSKNLSPELVEKLKNSGIDLLKEKDRQEIITQLLGKVIGI